MFFLSVLFIFFFVFWSVYIRVFQPPHYLFNECFDGERRRISYNDKVIAKVVCRMIDTMSRLYHTKFHPIPHIIPYYINEELFNNNVPRCGRIFLINPRECELFRYPEISFILFSSKLFRTAHENMRANIILTQTNKKKKMVKRFFFLITLILLNWRDDVCVFEYFCKRIFFFTFYQNRNEEFWLEKDAKDIV